MEKVIKLKVFIGSPSDLGEERVAFLDAIDEINDLIAKNLGVFLEPANWEAFTFLESRPAQVDINEHLRSSDLVVLLLGEKWGTPTEKYSSGFEEEFVISQEMHKIKNVKSLLYCKNLSEEILASSNNDIKQIKEFKRQREIRQDKTYIPFNDKNDWKARFKRDLTNWLFVYSESKDSHSIEGYKKDVIRGMRVQETITTIGQNDIESTNNLNKPEKFKNIIDEAAEHIKRHNPEMAMKILSDLKDGKWEECETYDKYRILANIGAAQLELNCEPEAAKYFIDALEFNDDEKALCNAALGYLLQDEYEKCKELVNKVLKKNPENKYAISLLVQTFSGDSGEILLSLSDVSIKSAEIANALANIERKKRNFSLAVSWYENAIKYDGETSPELYGWLGETQLESVMRGKSVDGGYKPNFNEKDVLKKALLNLEKAWSLIDGMEMQKYRTTWIFNIGVIKGILGDIESSIKCIDKAIEMQPENAAYIKQRALIARENNDIKGAISFLKNIQKIDIVPDVPLILAQLYIEDNYPSEAEKLLRNILVSNGDIRIKNNAFGLLVELFVGQNNNEEAEKLLQDGTITGIEIEARIITEARYYLRNGMKEKAIQVLSKIDEIDINKISYINKLRIADIYYALDKSADAIKYYETVVDLTENSKTVHKLISSYNIVGDMNKVLELSSGLRKIYGPLEIITELEVDIYETIGDLPMAKEICELFLNKYPNNKDMQIRLATICLRLDELELVDEFLKKDIDISELSIDAIIHLARLYAFRKHRLKTIELMYELRRKHYNNPDVHLKYIGFFLAFEKTFKEDMLPAIIGKNSAVLIDDGLGNVFWRIIEEREDIDLKLEIPENHFLSKMLLGKKVGDAIVITKSPYEVEKGIVKKVVHKYVYAYRDSLEMYERLFPGRPGLWKVKVNDTKEDISNKLGRIVDEQNKRTVKYEDAYKMGMLTLGAFAQSYGRNIIDIWAGLVSNTEIGLNCATSDFMEIKQTGKLLKKKNILAIDLLTVISVHYLGVQEDIINNFKLIVPQSLLDELKQIIFEREKFHRDGTLSVAKQGENYVKRESSAVEIRESINTLKKIYAWVKRFCEVKPVKEFLKYNYKEYKKLQELIGENSLDTALLAKGNDCLLFSEDERFRSFVKNDKRFLLDGVWTQCLLVYLTANGVVSREKYAKTVVKQASNNYHYTFVDDMVLLTALEESGYEKKYPFTSVIKVFSKIDKYKFLEIMPIFLLNVWQEIISEERRNDVLDVLCDVILNNNESEYLFDNLARSVMEVAVRQQPILYLSAIDIIEKFNNIRLQKTKNKRSFSAYLTSNRHLIATSSPAFL